MAQPAHNLPAPRSSLVARELEIATVRDLFLERKKRLVTLTGVGGCGKTRLALQVATDLLPLFDDGVWIVELAGVTDEVLVPHEIASTLGMMESANSSIVETLTSFLRPKRLVLLLDNCEHMLDACAQLADHLLNACSHLHILATSREPLQIAGEWQQRVAPLQVPSREQARSVESALRNPAVALFIERAQSVVPTFRLTTENVTSICEVCSRVDGIPLALELTAARVRVLTIEQIRSRLHDCIRLLTGGSRAGPTRQQTLKATLDWSYDLLTPHEQAVFRRLAVFAGWFSLEAAESICARDGIGPDGVVDLLTRLVDKSLLLVDVSHLFGWYRMLEPVRQYAALQLDVMGETEGVRTEHAGYYLSLAEKIEHVLHSPEQYTWLRNLDQQQDDIRNALGWAVERRDAEQGLRAAAALVPYWEMRGHLSEGRRWLETALALATDSVSADRVRALTGAGHLAHMQGKYVEAETLLREGLTLARRGEDRRVIAVPITELGMVLRLKRELEESERCLVDGLTMYREVGDRVGIAFALFNLGSTLGVQGNSARCVELVEESLAHWQELGDLRQIAFTKTMLGVNAVQDGNHRAATTYLSSSLVEHRRMGDRWFIMYALMGIAWANYVDGRLNDTARLLGAAAALGDSSGDQLTRVGRVTFAPLLEAVRRYRDDEAFAASWSEGHAMSLDAAVDYALSIAASEQAGTATVKTMLVDPLTRREREVAALLAQGYSDRQIAEALSISFSTARVHVHHVLEKLGVHSRWQVAGTLGWNEPLGLR